MITNKPQMYCMLINGEFGNTVPQFLSVEKWKESGLHLRYKWWGVRSLIPGGPCRLNCPADEVEWTVSRPDFVRSGINISTMLDKVCNVTLWGEVWDSPSGLVVYGIEYPPKEWTWREYMPIKGRHWHGSDARYILRKHLNPNSYDDTSILLEKYPDHILEFSATDVCIGTVPHRNTVMWEVRNY